MFKIISLCVSNLLYKGVIISTKNFILYPFIIPKKQGALQFIIDYGHLKQAKIYNAPKFKLYPITASLGTVTTLHLATIFVKIDLREVFHLMPLLCSLFRVSTFHFTGKYYQFHQLPMGLFLSLFLLQHTLRAVLQGVPHHWVHIDDILIWDSSVSDVKNHLKIILQ